MTSSEQQIAKHHALAQKSMTLGNFREAHQRCLAILKLDKTFADAWFLCGIIAARNGQLGKATEILGNAIKLEPGNAEYRAELGRQLLASNLPERALLEAEEAMLLHPVDLPTLNTLGTVFSHTGEHEKALRCFENAAGTLEQRPRNRHTLSGEWQADFYFNMAASLQFSGRFEDADSAYEKAIKIQPLMFKAHAALASVRLQTPEHNHLKRLQNLQDKAASARDTLHLGHAMAKEQEDLGNYKEAFRSLQWAKQSQVEKAVYNYDADVELFATVTRSFSRELFRGQDTGYQSAEPIFVVGMPRTGTTLVEQILGCHSKVYAAGELQQFPLQVKRMTAMTTAGLVDTETLAASLRLDMATLGATYIDCTRPRTGHAAHFVDKLPLNFLLLGLIKLALPNAKLVCLRRDPMDACLSNYRQLFAPNFTHYHYNYNLLDCGRYYLLFDQLMQHWADVMPGTVHTVNYEKLVANPEQITRELLAYCELPWEDQCLSFHQRQTTVATPSAVHVRQGIYTSSVNRWQRFGDAMQPLYELLKSAGFYT